MCWPLQVSIHYPVTPLYSSTSFHHSLLAIITLLSMSMISPFFFSFLLNPSIHLNYLYSRLILIYLLSILPFLYKQYLTNDINFHGSIEYGDNNVTILSNKVKMKVIVLEFSESSLIIVSKHNWNMSFACSSFFYLELGCNAQIFKPSVLIRNTEHWWAQQSRKIQGEWLKMASWVANLTWTVYTKHFMPYIFRIFFVTRKPTILI